MAAKKEKQYRVGVIGGGAIAQACHLPGYAKNPYSNLVAVSDPSPERQAEIAAAYPGIKCYADHNEMLANEKLEVVSVCAPNRFHAAASIAAFKAGCHVLCEKPIATTLPDADKMLKAAKEARKKLMIAFSCRLYSGPMKCKELLKAKKIGKPFMIRVRFAHGGPDAGWAKSNWFFNPAVAAGGVMLDLGIHAIDLCLWLFGPAKAVYAKAATLVRNIPVDDNAVLVMEFQNGGMGYIEVGWTSKPGFKGIEIYGTDGSLICDFDRGLTLCTGKQSAGADSVVEWEMLDTKPTSGGWDIEIDHWMNVVRGKEKLSMDGQAGRDAMALALAAYKSSEKGKRIEIK